MTRKECLEQAMGCVLRDRNNEYGGPEDSFGVIANFWSVYLGRKVYPHDVAMMMSLLKIARIKANRGYADGYIDLAGYAACGAECASGKPVPSPNSGDAVEWYSFGARGMEPGWHSAVYLRRAEDHDYCVVREPDGRERIVDRRYLRRPAKAKAEGREEQAFQVGEHVQYRLAELSEGARWLDAWYLERHPNGRGHIVKSKSEGRIAVDPDKIRKAPKAEGCEALVEHDAPQTPAELYDKIIASNPATFGRPRTPTGEELAEMAEEDDNA